MKALAAAILVAGAMIAGTLLYSSERTSSVKIERSSPAPKRTPEPCWFGADC